MNTFADNFIEQHFTAWLGREIPSKDRERIENGIRAYLQEHMAVIDNGYSWFEIRELAEHWGFIAKA